MAEPVPPTPPVPPVVRTQVDWARYVQMILMAIVAAFTGTNAWQGAKPVDPNAPPPPPVVTPATLHDDNLRLEKKLDDVLEVLTAPTPKK